jgi:galactonate dehydratase
MVREHYIEQAPHNPLDPVSTAACLHFDLSTPLFAVQELHQHSGGSPGLGVELNEEAAPVHPFQLPGLRILQREDNSVSDW